MEHEHERRAIVAESNHKANNCPRRVIPYEEYVAHRADQKEASTAAKSTSQEESEENWDGEPPYSP